LDSTINVEKLKKVFHPYAHNITFCILNPFCITANYAFHFFRNGSAQVFQNVVRQKRIESLLHLDKEDARELIDKINNQTLSFSVISENGFSVFRKKYN
jgi:hypothetical protein